MYRFRSDRRAPTAGSSRALPGYSLRHLRLFGATCFLVLAGIAGGLLLGRSEAFAQQTRAAAQRSGVAAGNAENGQKVFSSEKCADCHGTQGEGGSGKIAAPRIGPPRFAFMNFLDAVRNAKAPMPAYASSEVSDAALTDVYAFLSSMAPAQGNAAVAPAGNADNGKLLFTKTGCYECHDRQGQGGVGTGPRLAPNPIAFSAFTHQCRQPVNQMPPYTSKVLSDAELADIYAYLQSIPQPPAAASIPVLQ